MPKLRRARKASSSDSDDSTSRPRYSPKLKKGNGPDDEPQPGTSAQALKDLRNTQANLRKKTENLGQSNKRNSQENTTETPENKRSRAIDSSSKPHPSESRGNVPGEKAPKPQSASEALRNRDNEISKDEQAPGIIKKISLYNFMCHSSFHKEWHPNLNFITGENGSGKSALLSGILVGLGARALTTSRTKSISQLIQTGKDCAKTEITLLNTNGLKSEKYGDEFTIERVISSNGASKYRIKCHGKYRALPRAELDYILLFLDIQLDNPLMILNQETARSFLRSKNPKDKYKLFYEGTMMAKIEELLRESKDYLSHAEKNIENYQEATKCVEHQTKHLQESYKKVEEVEKIKETINKIWAEYLWSLVKEAEKKKESKELHLQAASVEVEKFEEKLEQTLQKKTEIMGKPSDKEDEENARSSLKKKEALISQVRASYQKVRSQYSDSKSKLRGCDDRIRIRRERMEECQATIGEIQKKARENEEQMNAEYTNKKKELDTKKNATDRQVNTLKQDAEQFKCGADAIRKTMNELKDQDSTLKYRIDKTKKSMEQLRKSTSNKFTVYGREMEELIAKINANEREFVKKPIGPIGAYCTIKDSKWINLAESILSNFMTTFIVDNEQDFATLRNLINNLCKRYEASGNTRVKSASIFRSKFLSERFDISNGEARYDGIPTLLDLIEIEGNNPVIFNALCDYVNAERILLFENRTAALNLIANQRKCPRTCKSGYSLDFYQVTPYPNHAVWALANPNVQAKYLQTSKKEQISALRVGLINLQSDLQNITPLLEEKVKEEVHLREQHNERQTAVRNISKQLHKIETEIQRLNQKRNYQPDLTSQMEELTDLTKEYEEHVALKETAEKCLEESDSKMEELASEKNRIQAEIGVLTKLVSDLAEKSDGRQSQLQKIENVIGRITNVLTKRKSEQEANKKALEVVEAEWQRKLKTAEEVSPRLETDREPSELENEFQAMKKTIEQSAKILGTKEDIERKLAQNKRELDERRQHYHAIDNLYTLVNSCVQTQEFTFQKTKSETGAYLKALFFAMANQRGYQGNLLVEHESKELFYYVCPDGDAHSKITKAVASQDPKFVRKQLVDYSLGLSGGERSYATICFIISMWQVMGCPFFMLDEFDVFMDPFNRKTSQNALISHAKRCKANQFYFFTPLELTVMPSEEDACVLRMFPPIRVSDPVPNVNVSPSGSVGEVENTDPSDGSHSTKTNAKKRLASRPIVMQEKTNSRR